MAKKILDAWEMGEDENPEDKKAFLRDIARHFDGLYRVSFRLENLASLV